MGVTRCRSAPCRVRDVIAGLFGERLRSVPCEAYQHRVFLHQQTPDAGDQASRSAGKLFHYQRRYIISRARRIGIRPSPSHQRMISPVRVLAVQPRLTLNHRVVRTGLSIRRSPSDGSALVHRQDGFVHRLPLKVKLSGMVEGDGGVDQLRHQAALRHTTVWRSRRVAADRPRTIPTVIGRRPQPQSPVGKSALVCHADHGPVDAGRPAEGVELFAVCDPVSASSCRRAVRFCPHQPTGRHQAPW